MIWLSLAVLALAVGLWSASSPQAQRKPNAAQGANREASRVPIELVLDLAASLLAAGLPVTEVLDHLGRSIGPCRSLSTVARCIELGMEWERCWEPVEPWLQPLAKALHFAQRTGAPAGSLLHHQAQLRRGERLAAVSELGAQFATRLVLPLGVCALPSFIALGVVPLIIALVPSL
ncbi:hypothetical protein GCM10027417_01420 [Glutamicibacter endophyticus]